MTISFGACSRSKRSMVVEPIRPQPPVTRIRAPSMSMASGPLRDGDRRGLAAVEIGDDGVKGLDHLRLGVAGKFWVHRQRKLLRGGEFRVGESAGEITEVGVGRQQVDGEG